MIPLEGGWWNKTPYIPVLDIHHFQREREMFVVLLLLLSGAVALDTIHSLDPSYQMYPAVLQGEWLGVGTSPIRYVRYLVDTQYDNILMPHSEHEDCNVRRRVYLDLGGPKPFWTQGCSPIEGVVVLGLGAHSPLWSTFEGYHNRGGRLQMLSSLATDSEEPAVYGQPPPTAHLANSSFTYHAAKGTISSKRSYISRADGVPSGATGLAIASVLVYLRSKVVRKLVFWWQESDVSRTARIFTALYQVVALPISLEVYGTRALLEQDLGLLSAVLIQIMGYLAAVALLGGMLLRLVLHFVLKERNEAWAMRLDMLSQLTLSTSTLLTVWLSTQWYAAADSGSFIGLALLSMMMYEQVHTLYLSLASLASGVDRLDPVLMASWWMGVQLPLVAMGVWATASFGVQPFLENRLASQRLMLRAASICAMCMLWYMPSQRVCDGVARLFHGFKHKST